MSCRPILWDYTSELYKRVDLKDAVWEEVARSLGPQFSGKCCINVEKKTGKLFLSKAKICYSMHVEKVMYTNKLHASKVKYFLLL